MFDPSTIVSSIDAAWVLGKAIGVARALGAPVALVAVLGLFWLLVKFWGAEIEVRPAPPPISDGGAAADRDLPPARPGDGGPRVISDGGAPGDAALPPAQPGPPVPPDDPGRTGG